MTRQASGSFKATATGAELNSVFLLPVLDRWLLVAPLHQTSALMNAAGAREIADGFSERCNSLRDLAETLDEEPLPPPRPREGPLNPLFLGLIPTRACNLNCGYCGFGARQASDRQMDIQLAISTIDWMAERSVRLGRNSLDVHFFGGEPFIAEDFIDVAVHRAHAVAAAYGLKPRLEAATNGVFSESRARFIGDYFDTVVLSFDGPAEVHNRQRPRHGGAGSFDAVRRTAELLSESPARLCLRVCVTSDNVGQLDQTVRDFCESYRPSVIDFETLQPTREAAESGLTPPDPYQFAAAFFRARREADRYGVVANYAASVHDEPRASFCPVGKDALIVAPDGRLNACYLREEDWQQRGMDLNLGAAGIGETWAPSSEAVDRVRTLVADKPRCRKCFCRWWCAGGCHVNHSFPGCAFGYNDFCIQTRLITATSLLEELGASDLAERLLEDTAGSGKLAAQESDIAREVEFSDGRFA